MPEYLVNLTVCEEGLTNLGLTPTEVPSVGDEALIVELLAEALTHRGGETHGRSLVDVRVWVDRVFYRFIKKSRIER